MHTAMELQDLYLDYVEDTECPILYHRWSFIVGLGAMLERKVWLPFGYENIYPNQYVVLLGPPAARKSTAINTLCSLIQESGYTKFAGDKSSKEKFIEDLSKGFDIEKDFLHKDDFDFEELLNSDVEMDSPDVSSVFIKASELQDFLGINNHDFISWLTNMWDNLPVYHHRTKNGNSCRVSKPTISLLGGATSATFQKIFPSDILEQGMASRMLLVYGEGQRKKIAFPSIPDPERKAQIISYLIKIRNSTEGEIKVSKKAKKILTHIYENLKSLPDTRLETYLGRRFTHLLKMCIIFAASRLSREINEEDAILANTILTYTEALMPQALGEFGKTDKGKFLNVILAKVKASGDLGLTYSQLRSQIVDLNIDIHVILSLVEQLSSLGRIDQIKQKTETGDTITKLMYIQRNSKLEGKYVDFSLLREYDSKFTSDSES